MSRIRPASAAPPGREIAWRSPRTWRTLAAGLVATLLLLCLPGLSAVAAGGPDLAAGEPPAARRAEGGVGPGLGTGRHPRS
ncbi:hypothetical protein, partial [Streptomyces sp. N35]|uniref:hypothetical protein n=1 Tax=Streptomyces sp. N35 TaxID=2795730 RepID=UPI0018F5E2A2